MTIIFERVYVIDEIGKMECFSTKFCLKMAKLLDSNTPVFGSIALKGEGFIREVKLRSDVEVVEVTPNNRDSFLVTTLVQKIMEMVIL